ncbi:hypothetical protein [Xylella fastidiosa]|nr:hypothetical protein [Xylella fastidiosa]MDD0866683.1 hypothetical protein [Xylella fastidiosa subsp. multiplex]MDD0878174.1 hypothetical protein [Xylella fastidiosa subsp. multiplex]MDD0937261.1 hypothetical protein [Xylella fastidiosa subsp. multiplex]MDD0946628.1 hypothetical protein [Xylella fastidiosa subsp. multiplex]
MSPGHTPLEIFRLIGPITYRLNLARCLDLSQVVSRISQRTPVIRALNL